MKLFAIGKIKRNGIGDICFDIDKTFLLIAESKDAILGEFRRQYEFYKEVMGKRRIYSWEHWCPNIQEIDMGEWIKIVGVCNQKHL